MTLPAIVPIRSHLDARGSLGVVEETDLPFEIKRVYYLFDVPIGAASMVTSSLNS